jgi:hypothetical protein
MSLGTILAQVSEGPVWPRRPTEWPGGWVAIRDMGTRSTPEQRAPFPGRSCQIDEPRGRIKWGWACWVGDRMERQFSIDRRDV